MLTTFHASTACCSVEDLKRLEQSLLASVFAARGSQPGRITRSTLRQLSVSSLDSGSANLPSWPHQGRLQPVWARQRAKRAVH